MTPNDEPPPQKPQPASKPRREVQPVDEARRNIEEYAADLRKLIGTLRRRLLY
ncbi:hypothetical protein [Bradyrhizobium sp. DOA9]|uniref:hypothetical protein n=1 Tax=Bradyrhizobium sp. DOA9 TaxID=1126627 RepID=UPI000AB40995|nr:hypothetical protein [Bradyrhizobium sp. DOA9]